MENLSGRTLFVAAVDAEAAHIPDSEALLITGIGTVPAAISLTEVLAEARAHDALPERVVNIGTAGALGDAGSPASDSTLGPTAGLGADGQHDHIRDSVIPTFIHFNIPLLIAGWAGALML